MSNITRDLVKNQISITKYMENIQKLESNRLIKFFDNFLPLIQYTSILLLITIMIHYLYHFDNIYNKTDDHLF